MNEPDWQSPSNDSDDDVHPLVQGLTFVVIGVFLLYGLWATVIAFTGGRLPIIGITLQGGLLSGLLWIFVFDPILLSVGFLISMVIVLPVQVLISWLAD